MLAEAKAADEQQTLDGTDDSPTRLPPELANLESRRQQVRDALAKARAADEARKSKGTNPEENPAQVPTTDTDSRVMPNKEGGYAPNYTPTAITDGHAGFIIDSDVLSEVNETPALLPGVERIEDMFGETPEKLLTDAGNNSGAVLQGLEEKGIEVYAPVEFSEPQPGNPAHRNDPTQPVPEADWQALPRNSKGKLAKSCFAYDAEQDQYYCPQGKAMPYEKMKSDERGGEKVPLRVYRCSGCAGCPLAAACLEKTAKHGRTITRDGFEPVRDRTAARMASEAGRRVYNQRPRIAEQPFGILKRVMDLRRFLLRGLEKVKTEWTWSVTAFSRRCLGRPWPDCHGAATSGASRTARASRLLLCPAEDCWPGRRPPPPSPGQPAASWDRLDCRRQYIWRLPGLPPVRAPSPQGTEMRLARSSVPGAGVKSPAALVDSGRGASWARLLSLFLTRRQD